MERVLSGFCPTSPTSERFLTVSGTPSLLQLCMQQAVRSLLLYADRLQFLPLGISSILVQEFLARRPLLRELQIVCGSCCRPQSLCLSGVEHLNAKVLQHLIYLGNLVRLDLAGCSWLNDLSFLPGLKSLECLILCDCWYLPGECISYVQELLHLQCLDVENVTSITDKLAAYYLPGLKELQALNVSGTSVGDGLVEALTYGSRLHAWVVNESSSDSLRRMQATQSGGDGNEVLEQLLQQWPASHLTYLRLQRTLITQASISHLLAIPDFHLLDVQGTNVTGRSILPIQVKHRLVALPNNTKLAARTNAMLARVLEGKCGCKAMALQNVSIAVDPLDDELLFAQWDQAAIQLLQSASLESSCWV